MGFGSEGLGVRASIQGSTHLFDAHDGVGKGSDLVPQNGAQYVPPHVQLIVRLEVLRAVRGVRS